MGLESIIAAVVVVLVNQVLSYIRNKYVPSLPSLPTPGTPTNPVQPVSPNPAPSPSPTPVIDGFLDTLRNILKSKLSPTNLHTVQDFENHVSEADVVKKIAAALKDLK